jgi:hypothetical protein
MIKIKPSKTADSRTCDFSQVSIETLLQSSEQHINDVEAGLMFFAKMLGEASANHDKDKITDIERFHADFVTGFEQKCWWERHKALNRHHLTELNGIPVDVNLIDVLDYITDCCMAGMARSGSVRPLTIDPMILMAAFHNTVDLLKKEISVVY